MEGAGSIMDMISLMFVKPLFARIENTHSPQLVATSDDVWCSGPKIGRATSQNHPQTSTLHLQVPSQKVFGPSWHPPQTPQKVLGGLGPTLMRNTGKSPRPPSPLHQDRFAELAALGVGAPGRRRAEASHSERPQARAVGGAYIEQS